jgi:O-antigen ligase
MRNITNNKIEQIIGLIILGLVFLLPIITCSKTASPIGMDSFNKNFILWLVMPLLMAAWLYLNSGKDKFSWRRTPLDLPIFILILVIGISTLFSTDIFSSLFGAYSGAANPYLSFLSLVMFFYIFVQLRPSRAFIANIARILLILQALMALILTVLIVGVWTSVFSEGELFVRLVRQAWGSVEDTTLLLAALDLFVLGLLSGRAQRAIFLGKRYLVKIAWILLYLSFIFIIFSNFVIAWWALLLGSILIYFVKIRQDKIKNIKRQWDLKLITIILVALLSLAMLLINYTSIDERTRERRLSRELKLDIGSSLDISLAAVKDSPALGQGGEQFSRAFSLYRNKELNNTLDWDKRFNRSGSQILEIFTTNGIIGLLSYLVFIGVLVRAVILHLRSRNSSQLASLAGILVIILTASQFIYTTNILFSFLFWLFAAIFITGNNDPQGNQAELDINAGKQRKILFLFAALFLLAGWVGLSTVLAKQWSAEYIFQNEQGVDSLRRAIRLSPGRYQYQIALANKYREQALKKAEQAKGI